MSYFNEGEGLLSLTPALDKPQVQYLQAFIKTRHCKRDENKCQNISDILREKIGVPVGIEGQYSVYSADFNFIESVEDEAVLDYDSKCSGCPELWCGWDISDNGKELFWYGGELSRMPVEWIEYLKENFFDKWNVEISNEVKWKGSNRKDKGTIKFTNNKLTVERN